MYLIATQYQTMNENKTKYRLNIAIPNWERCCSFINNAKAITWMRYTLLYIKKFCFSKKKCQNDNLVYWTFGNRTHRKIRRFCNFLSKKWYSNASNWLKSRKAIAVQSGTLQNIHTSSMVPLFLVFNQIPDWTMQNEYKPNFQMVEITLCHPRNHMEWKFTAS